MSGKLKSGFSLSPVQQRLWQLAQRDGQQTYLVSVDFHCAGVDEALLCLAFDHVLTRHEILRMEFGVLPGMQLPVQAPAETLASTQIAPPQLAAIHEDQRACLQKLNDSHYRLGLSALCADAQTALLILTEVEEKLADAAWCAAPHVIKFADEDLPFTSLAQWQHDMLAEPQDVQLPVWDAANSLVAGNLPDWPFMRRQRQAKPYVKRQPLALSEADA